MKLLSLKPFNDLRVKQKSCSLFKIQNIKTLKNVTWKSSLLSILHLKWKNKTRNAQIENKDEWILLKVVVLSDFFFSLPLSLCPSLFPLSLSLVLTHWCKHSQSHILTLYLSSSLSRSYLPVHTHTHTYKRYLSSLILL